MPKSKRGALLAAVLFLFPALLPGVEPARLADAAQRSDIAAVRELLAVKENPGAPQVDGMTALHWAAREDNAEMAKLLLAAGANATVENRYHVTPLALACTNGSEAMVDLLLAAGADPNSTLPGGETALMTAARTGRTGPVKSLLAHHADVNAKERHGQTALMWAAAEGSAKVIDLLIAAGADFTTALDSGFSPLTFAVREGRTEAVRVLLEAGADVNGTMEPHKPNGKGPRPGTSPLVLAVENGHFELALALVEAGANPNDQRSGFTALHLLSWVRKPNRGDGDDGDPAPTGSGKMGSLDFVRAMAKHGADVNVRLQNEKSGGGRLGRNGNTPFYLAAVTDDVAYMRLLVELGADPLLGNEDGTTPLMAAAGVGSRAPTEEAGTEEDAAEAVQLAIDLGGDVNTVDKGGETAMHGAAYKNVPKVVQLLADKGADIRIWNQKNKHGWTPLRIAEGYRPGNFAPSPETVAALQRVMLAAGVAPPASPTAAIRAESAGQTAP